MMNVSIILQIKLFLLANLYCLPEGWKVNLSEAKKSYRILMLLPYTYPSHQHCFLPLAIEMANRGHKITILSHGNMNTNHKNITEIDHGVLLFKEQSNISIFDFKNIDPHLLGFGIFDDILEMLVREMYKNPMVKKLYENRKKFDMFIIDEMFNEPAFPFINESYYISIAPPGPIIATSAVMGNVLNPAYVSGFFVDYSQPYSIWNRVKNLIQHIYLPFYWRYYDQHPRLQKQLNANFSNIKTIEEIEKNHIISFVNSYFSIDNSIPLLPSQIETGGLHCKDPKKLPEFIEDFIDDSKAVVYFSLGSICDGKMLPKKLIQILIKSFKKLLKYKIIWKYEEKLEDLSENVLTNKWMPQQDILGDRRTKLFITHGGILSLQESVYHAVPMLALPIFADQERNSFRMQNRGLGKMLKWDNFNEENFVEYVQELISNERYRNNVKEASKIFRDRPESPLQKAVWWTEYVIRHKGAPHLKSPAASLSWIQYFMLDVALTINITIFSAYWLVKKIVFALIESYFKNSRSGKKKSE